MTPGSVADPVARALAASLLVREVLARGLVHDARGALTVALGWADLLRDEADPSRGPLVRSLRALEAELEEWASVAPAGVEPACHLRDVAHALGIPLTGSAELRVDALALGAALEASEITAIEVRGTEGGELVRLRLSGLSAEAVDDALTLGGKRLRAALATGLPGSVLLRLVARARGGDLVVNSSGQPELLLPGAAGNAWGG